MFAGLARSRVNCRVYPVVSPTAVVSIRADDPDYINFEVVNATFSGATVWLPTNAAIGKMFTFVLVPHPQINPTLTTERINIKAPLNRGGSSFVQTATLIAGQAIRFIYTQNGWVIPAGGVTNFADARNTASPNATVPVHSLTPAGSEADIDVAITPKGSGALTRWVADGTTAGGNKRGANATDWQVTGLVATWVASGDYSVISGGRYNTAAGTYSVVSGGYNNAASSGGTHNTIGGGEANSVTAAHTVVSGGKTNSATAQYASVGGGNSNQATATGARVGGGASNVVSNTYGTIAGGNSNTISANYATIGGGISNTASGAQSTVGGGESNTASGISSCVPGGKEATTRGIEGMLALASGKIGTLGDAQYGKYVIRRATTDATASALTTTGAAASTTNGVILPNNSTYTFKGLVSARNTANGDSSGWEFTGVIKRGANAAATALVAAVTPTLIAQDAGASTWVLAVTADTTNGGLSVTVTGVAATTIRWVATVDTVEVTN